MKPIKTLVALASEAEARLLVNEGPGKGLQELAGLRADDFAQTAHAFSDSPGRQSAAPGMARHGFEARESPRDARRAGFAALIIDAMGEARAAGGHQRIVLAAPPKLLGELRAAMPEEMAQAVTAELPKDLVKLALRDLPSHFEEVAAF